VTISGSSIEDTLTEAVAQATVNVGPTPEKVGRAGVQQEDQQVQHSQASTVHPPGQRSPPGRRPLFRTR
jgi:hypothetical protein